MVIKRLHIDDFGRFQHHTMDLDPAFNVIYGQNEEGKSTLMAFIRLMFYGFSGRPQDISKNLRQRYKPWNGADMKGHILFEHRGTIYRLERTFGQTQAKDQVKVLNETTGSPVSVRSSQEPGAYFFDLDEEAFCKSVFIGQGASVISSSAKNDQITERLLQSVTSGGEDVPYQTALSAVRCAKEALVSKNGKNGEVARRREQLTALQRDKSRAEGDEEDKAREQQMIFSLLAEKDDLLRQRQEICDELECRRIILEKQRAQDALVRERRHLNLRTDEAMLRRELMGENGMITRRFIDETEEILRRIDECVSHGSVLEQAAAQRSLELDELKQQAPPEVTQDLLELLGRQEAKQQTLAQEIRQAQAEAAACERVLEKMAQKEAEEAELRILTASFHEADQTVNTLEEQMLTADQQFQNARQEAEQLLREKQELEIAAAGDEREMRLKAEGYDKIRRELQGHLQGKTLKPGTSAAPNVLPRKTTGNNRTFLVALGMAAVFAAAGILVHPRFYAGLALALVYFLLTRPHRPGAPERDQKEEQGKAAAEAQALMKDLGAKLDKTRQRLGVIEEASTKNEACRQALEAKLKELGPLFEKKRMERTRLETLKNSVRMSLERLTKEVSGLDAPERNLAVLTDDIRLKQDQWAESENASRILLLSCGAIDRHDALNRHYQHNAWQNRAADLEKQLRVDFAGLETIRQDKQAHEAEVMRRVAFWRQPDTIDEARAILLELKGKAARLEALSLEVGYAANGRQTAEKNQTPEELEQLVLDCTKKLQDKGWDARKALPDDQEASDLQAQADRLGKRIGDIEKNSAAREAEVREKYRSRPNISQIEEQIQQTQEILMEKERDFSALSTAEQTLQEAFEELQQSFGPLLNQRTGDIFSRITGGKYHSVRIDRDFSISVEERAHSKIRESGYLSGGTVDQAYLALRLAVCELIAQAELPLFLDDVFTQYDDERALEGLKFLYEYRQEKQAQTVVFTCHTRIRDWADVLQGIQVQRIS